jgi:hypothetical protein
MKTKFAIIAIIASAFLANSAEKPPDLTGQDVDSFKAHLGRMVVLRGRLEEGVQGPCLFGAAPTNVVFYVIPDMPTSGSYSYPSAWEQLMHQQVRLTGELKYRSFKHSKEDSLVQVPPDYYYMVLQRTSIERVESK